MFESCIYVDDECDWYYEDVEHEKAHVTDVDEKCCECDAVIPAGIPHDRYVGVLPADSGDAPGQVDTFCTCQVCMSIWDSLAGGDRRFGELESMISNAYAIPLCDVPGTQTDDEWQSLIDQYSYDEHALHAAAQPNGQPKISRVLAALDLLEDFLNEEQLKTVFEWATSAGHDANESAQSMQERIDYLTAALERANGTLREYVRDASLPGPTVRQEISALDAEALMFDGFDDAVIGTVHRCGQPMLVAYGYDSCVSVLVRDGLTPEEAQEWMTYNVEGGWLGDRTPCVVHALEDKQL